MSRFLDPRSDLVFKRIFGEHPDILRDFLNDMLPFEDDSEFIAELEYLPAEQAPEVPLFKNTLVDVRCRDRGGRQFIVEMQMAFTRAFLQRVLFNASKAYVRQLERGEDYELLCPVYGLSLLDDVFDRESPEYYHDYRIVETGNPHRVLEGLRLVFVELPKYREASPREARRLRWAWLRFLKEAGDAGRVGHPSTEQFRAEVGVSDSLRKALSIAEECGHDPAQLEHYDRFWDMVSRERTLMGASHAKGLAEGLAKGLERGREEGKREMAAALKKAGVLSIEQIAALSGLREDEVVGL